MNSKKLKLLNKKEFAFLSDRNDLIKKDLRNTRIHFVIPKTSRSNYELKSAHNLESTARRFKQLGLFRK